MISAVRFLIENSLVRLICAFKIFPVKPKSLPIFPLASKGIINSPSKLPLIKTFSNCLLTIFGRKIDVIFVKSLFDWIADIVKNVMDYLEGIE